MFLIDNVLIALIFALFLFVLFTIVNVYSFTRDILTSMFLSANLLYLFFVMPFKGVNRIHKNRKGLIKHLRKDPNLDADDIAALRTLLASKKRIFILLFKNGTFSYNDLVLQFSNWYLNKPFKIRLRISFSKKVKQQYETAYITELQNDLKTAITVFQ
ncbi:hypothetical protein [Lysinibacillus telephonicus]|uniref:hypothetical protein n=1 Tax=Lysinibacillus telephonicus TaxID=1714840 RepID=UPI0037D7B228